MGTRERISEAGEKGEANGKGEGKGDGKGKGKDSAPAKGKGKGKGKDNGPTKPVFKPPKPMKPMWWTRIIIDPNKESSSKTVWANVPDLLDKLLTTDIGERFAQPVRKVRED